jgi:hypothetical protein
MKRESEAMIRTSEDTTRDELYSFRKFRFSLLIASRYEGTMSVDRLPELELGRRNESQREMKKTSQHNFLCRRARRYRKSIISAELAGSGAEIVFVAFLLAARAYL